MGLDDALVGLKLNRAARGLLKNERLMPQPTPVTLASMFHTDMEKISLMSIVEDYMSRKRYINGLSADAGSVLQRVKDLLELTTVYGMEPPPPEPTQKKSTNASSKRKKNSGSTKTPAKGTSQKRSKEIATSSVPPSIATGLHHRYLIPGVPIINPSSLRNLSQSSSVPIHSGLVIPQQAPRQDITQLSSSSPPLNSTSNASTTTTGASTMRTFTTLPAVVPSATPNNEHRSKSRRKRKAPPKRIEPEKAVLSSESPVHLNDLNDEFFDSFPLDEDSLSTLLSTDQFAQNIADRINTRIDGSPAMEHRARGLAVAEELAPEIIRSLGFVEGDNRHGNTPPPLRRTNPDSASQLTNGDLHDVQAQGDRARKRKRMDTGQSNNADEHTAKRPRVDDAQSVSDADQPHNPQPQTDAAQPGSAPGEVSTAPNQLGHLAQNLNMDVFLPTSEDDIQSFLESLGNEYN
eukprot:CAMPEP_0117437608 /NCGR_PEP_ID=MMETSP0759-20121206/1612_1 /TAXON_ID=63605 /ORGANISM="Percolomonas cosmopolitus, Strain WS" /LENGTH=461 /DNA_ID=CAMNT_0005229247 /DNA_START=206 /DNA_END=1589 /DNA_ORIENTATION=-